MTEVTAGRAGMVDQRNEGDIGLQVFLEGYFVTAPVRLESQSWSRICRSSSEGCSSAQEAVGPAIHQESQIWPKKTHANSLGFFNNTTYVVLRLSTAADGSQ